MIPGDNKYIFGGLVISKFQLMNSNFGENDLKFPNHTHSDLFCILANLRIFKPHKNDELVTSQTLMLPLIKTFFFFMTGLTTLSLLRARSHQAGRRWKISGSVVAALEPFLLSVSDNVMTLWDQRDGSPIQDAAVTGHVIRVITAPIDIQTVQSKIICHSRNRFI